MAALFQNDQVAFAAESDSLPDVTRHYDGFAECAAEMGFSRILGGIHYSFSNEEGLRLGRRVGELVWDVFAQRTGLTPRIKPALDDPGAPN